MQLPWIVVTLLVIFFRISISSELVEDELQAEFESLANDEFNQERNETWEDAEPQTNDSSESIDPTDSPLSKDEDSLSEKDPDFIEPRVHETNLGGSDNDGKKSVPQADEEDCGNPPVVEHAKIVGKKKPQYGVGTTLPYVCEYGYSSDGSAKSSECLLSESTQTLQWTDPGIVCIPRSCGDPGYVADAHRSGSLFTFPNSVSYECEEGYGARGGSGMRYCQPSGSWSGTLPSCEKIACKAPHHPINGRVSYSSLEFGSQLTYECENGYLLRNHHTRLCSADGTWSGDEPFCHEAKCDPPVNPVHGSVQVVGGDSVLGSVALYTCDPGLVLSGAATSKCLNIGEWTFPTPKCLQPCSIPSVSNGKIGMYETSYRGKKKFKELKEGTNVHDGKELFLWCEGNYEPMGMPSLEEKITCSRGEWSAQPRCEPASCKSQPPPTANSDRYVTNSAHGGTVTYYCNRYSKKTAIGNMTCHYGTWRGITPVCKDSRCHAESLSFQGLKKTNKPLYMNGESFTPTCEGAYTVAKPRGRLTCMQGTWRGHLPPCTAASCSQEPPSIDYGFAKAHSKSHSSIVTYECDEFFELKESNSKVQCQLGSWIGQVPRCQDSRCHVEDLKKSEGLSSDTVGVTTSGSELQVRCLDGYTPSGTKPSCVRGVWTERQPPCRENGCTVYSLDNGAFMQSVRKQKSYIVRTSVWYENERVKIGERKLPQTTLDVVCNSARYTFQGRGTRNVSVTCSQGAWSPHPVCQITGVIFKEEKQPINRVAVLSERNGPPVGEGAVESTEQKKTGSQHGAAEVAQPGPEMRRNSTAADSCFCTYHGDEVNLVAHAGSELLRSGAKVKDGCKVQFSCKHFGFSRLRGAKNITCKECRTWHSSEFPDCLDPVRGDPLIAIQDDWKLLPGGIVGIDRGKSANIVCFANGAPIYPAWFTTSGRAAKVYDQSAWQSDGTLAYITSMELQNLTPAHNGEYTCDVPGYNSIRFQIQVLEPVVNCSKFEEGNTFVIAYDKGQAVNSSAMFSCKKQNEKLIGSSVLTCLPNGQWSGSPPLCKIKCPDLAVTNGDLQVTYSKDLEVGSTAAFHCFAPLLRSGVAHASCGANGRWSDPLPSCILPSCALEDFFKVVPENVVPRMENVKSDTLPYNFILHLTCNDNTMLSGSQTATCGKEGSWVVPKVQCVPGCPPVPKLLDSGLIIEPNKDYYRFGETLTFSCEPGQVLGSDVVRIMCLNSGWSETEVPDCQEEKEELEIDSLSTVV